MKRWIHASNKPHTISRNKLRLATYAKDEEKLVSFCTDKDLELAMAEFQKVEGQPRIQWYNIRYLDEARWASDHNLSAKDLKQLNLAYIIDTKGHIDSASLSDNEDMRDTEYISLKSAIQSVIESIHQALEKYNNKDNVVRGYITLSIFGYGQYSLEYKCNINCLDSWGLNRNSLWYVFKDSYLVCDEDLNCSMRISDVLTDNTRFKRQVMPAINRYLSDPLSIL